MKLKFIIGMLICFISLTGTALAADTIYLNVDNIKGAGVDVQTVTATLDSANSITFRTVPVDSNPQGWFMGVGIPKGYTVSAVIDSNGNSLGSGWSIKENSQMDGFGRFLECTTTGENKPTWVTVTFSDGVITTDTKLCAEVAWGTGSCFFSNGEQTEIPEFPSIALPVAAMLGLMFVFGRKKEE